ncbi:UNVERIFIED_ORG: hypothetical protein B2H93_04450 [Clostridium botulinum]
MLDEPFNIKTIKISVNAETGHVVIKYRGNCGHQQLNRSEDNLFATKEEAQIKCNELNKERKYINLDEIVIQDSFKQSQPSIEKIIEKLNYYKNNDRFKSEIIVNKNNVLVDGYINYLANQILQKEAVRVIVE